MCSQLKQSFIEIVAAGRADLTSGSLPRRMAGEICSYYLLLINNKILLDSNWNEQVRLPSFAMILIWCQGARNLAAAFIPNSAARRRVTSQSCLTACRALEALSSTAKVT